MIQVKFANEHLYKKFLAYKKALTESEIDFFSHPDFVNHFAYGIQEITESTKIPFGISRFFIDRDDSTSAEFAIALRDDYHGMGLGKELLGFTANKAKLAGVKKLRRIILHL